MTSRSDRAAPTSPRFRAPPRFDTVRDVVVVAVTAALVAGFLAQAWRAPKAADPAAAVSEVRSSAEA